MKIKFKNPLIPSIIPDSDKCKGRMELFNEYADIKREELQLKKQTKLAISAAKTDKKLDLLRAEVLPKETARYMSVGKVVEDYRKKLRMKYRVQREKTRRTIAKQQKKDPGYDGSDLLKALDDLQAEHDRLVEEKRKQLYAEFDEAWAARTGTDEERQAAFDAQAEANKKEMADVAQKIEEKFKAKQEKFEAANAKTIQKWETRLEKALAREKAHREKQGIADVEPLPDDTVLSAKGLCMYFGGLHAVEQLDFDVKKGEIFGLIGPNGAGKTTVFNCITQFYKPTAGDIRFSPRDGETIRLTDYKVHDIITKGIARTFQNVELVKEVSVLENLLIAAHRQYHSTIATHVLHLPILKKEEKVIQRRADKVIEYMGLSEYRDRWAFGLPYGVLKRIEIARVLMCNPRLIILDEPAAGLNESETRELAALIRKIRTDYNCTILLVEHDMGLVMDICDHICAISFGKKLAYGTPKEVQSSREVQEAYLGVSEEEAEKEIEQAQSEEGQAEEVAEPQVSDDETPPGDVVRNDKKSRTSHKPSPRGEGGPLAVDEVDKGGDK